MVLSIESLIDTEIYSDDLRTQALARPLALSPRSRLALPRGAASKTSKVD